MPDDMRIPQPRTPEQLELDRAATSGQVSQLGSAPQGSRRNTDLDEILRGRHAGTGGALQFDILSGQADGDVFVVSGQFLVPEVAGRNDADAELKDLGFSRRGLSADNVRSPRMSDRVWVYSYERDDGREPSDAVDDALAVLARLDVKTAARTGVSALHMVVKAVDGPTPTSVTVDPFSEQEVAALEAAEDAITVAVIDTGIDEHLRADGWLNEVGRRSNDNIDELDVFASLGTPATPILDFAAGHGEFVAGIVRQVDPQARLVVYRALDTDGVSSEETVASAMIRAAEDGAHVINLSLGMQAVDGVVPPALKAAVDHIASLDNPPAIVASAGNYGTETPVYPGAFDEVVCVGALQGVEASAAGQATAAGQDPDGAEWSSRGSWVTCSSVGEGVVSTFVKGQEDPQFGGTDVYPQDSWAIWSGTSFAAPQIAAHIAKEYRAAVLAAQGSGAAAGSPMDFANGMFPRTNLPSDGFGTRVVLLEGTRPN